MPKTVHPQFFRFWTAAGSSACLLLFEVRPVYPVSPHSEEWFETFEKVNPLQANRTRSLLKRAGHGNICSTCGDPPVGNFQLLNGLMVVLKLCPACREIYSRKYGAGLTKVGENENAG